MDFFCPDENFRGDLLAKVSSPIVFNNSIPLIFASLKERPDKNPNHFKYEIVDKPRGKCAASGTYPIKDLALLK